MRKYISLLKEVKNLRKKFGFATGALNAE